MSYRVVVGSVKIEADTVEELVELLSRLQLDLGRGSSSVEAVQQGGTGRRPSSPGRGRGTLRALIESLPPRTKEFLKLLAGSPDGIERSTVAQRLGLNPREVSRIIAGLAKRARSAGYQLNDVMTSKRIRLSGRIEYFYTPSDALVLTSASPSGK
jgi:hypothetical protein